MYSLSAPLAPGRATELHHAVQLGNDGALARTPGLEQLGHTGQTTGNITGLGHVLGNLGQLGRHGHVLAVLHQQE